MTAATIDITTTTEATLSVQEAAQVLGISYKSAYRLIDRDEFPAKVLRLGRRIRISTASLRAYVGAEEVQ